MLDERVRLSLISPMVQEENLFGVLDDSKALLIVVTRQWHFTSKQNPTRFDRICDLVCMFLPERGSSFPIIINLFGVFLSVDLVCDHEVTWGNG